jgi:eukaryotic-like serine/threonine-protein kinase
MLMSTQSPAVQERLANAYRIEAELGRGGMARVYRVVHEASGARYALKRLIATGESSATLRAMFEHEYHTLVQLAHPHIVRVFEYGLDVDDPYYTMELLEGVDAHEATNSGQLDVRGICVLLRDCASALALVHARRLLHRDVSPRNLWCTPDQRGKLIDFGTLVAMGPQTRVAGTPPYLAPEALENQVLDARYDLFGLGALAYFMLTGRNAYPARSLADLPAHWRLRPARPDAQRSEVPRGLADLVMSMLSLDPRGRPRSAAEVYERVSAIAELPIEADRAAAQAYLTSPKLVGRDAAISQLRRRLQRVRQGRGSCVPIVGAGGFGKSRMVASALVEAKLAGALAIRADAGSVGTGALGLAEALIERLFAQAPLSAAFAIEHAGVLAHISPSTRQALGQPELTDLAGHERSRKLSAAILSLLHRLTEKQVLVIAVDDVHRADSASLNLIGQLSLFAETRHLMLVLGCDAPTPGAAPPPALQQLLRSRHRLDLRALAPEHTRDLLESLFGEGSGIDDAARWLHELSGGNPQACMQYAQYLVDARIARYDAGRWQLPNRLAGQGLPSTLRAMFEQRIRELSPDARELALGLALARDDSRAAWQPQTHIRVEHFPLLLAAGAAARAHAVLDELLRASIVEQRDQTYLLAQRALADVLLTSSDEAAHTRLHVRIAAIFDDLAYQTRWLPVRHLQLANQDARAIERVLDIADQYANRAADWAGMRVSLTVECTSRALRHLDAHGNTPRNAIELRRVLLMAASVYNWSYSREAGEAQLAQLRIDCGLDQWSQTDASQPDLQRVFACLKSAAERHEALPEAQRGLAPADALRELAGCVMVLYGAFVNSHDIERAKRMPPVVAPLRALSPVLALVADLAQLAVDRATGKEIGERTFKLGVVQLMASTQIPATLRQGASAINAYIQSIEYARRGNRRGIEQLVQRIVLSVGEEIFLVVHARWLANAFLGQDVEAERYRRQSS